MANLKVLELSMRVPLHRVEAFSETNNTGKCLFALNFVDKVCFINFV